MQICTDAHVIIRAMHFLVNLALPLHSRQRRMRCYLQNGRKLICGLLSLNTPRQLVAKSKASFQIFVPKLRSTPLACLPRHFAVTLMKLTESPPKIGYSVKGVLLLKTGVGNGNR